MKDFRVRIELPSLAVACCLVGIAFAPSLTMVAGFGLAITYALGCRLIAYRQAEDVAALSARLAKVEQDSAKALNLASAQARTKAPGY